MYAKKCDISIKIYRTGRNIDMAYFTFYEGIEQLFPGNYIEIGIAGDKLYLKGHDTHVKNSFRITTRNTIQIQARKTVGKLKSFEGDYDVEFDVNNSTYFIDRANRSEVHYSNAKDSFIGRQVNYNPGTERRIANRLNMPYKEETPISVDNVEDFEDYDDYDSEKNAAKDTNTEKDNNTVGRKEIKKNTPNTGNDWIVFTHLHGMLKEYLKGESKETDALLNAVDAVKQTSKWESVSVLLGLLADTISNSNVNAKSITNVLKLMCERNV